MPTITLADVQGGDVGVAHSKGFVAFVIRVVTRSKVNHAFVLEVVGPTPETTTVIQAEARGVSRTTLDKVAPGGYIELLAAPPEVDRSKVVAFARSRMGVRYGFASIASILFTLATPRIIRFDFRRSGTLVCSALVALSLLAGGWLEEISDYYQFTPAQVRRALRLLDGPVRSDDLRLNGALVRTPPP